MNRTNDFVLRLRADGSVEVVRELGRVESAVRRVQHAGRDGAQGLQALTGSTRELSTALAPAEAGASGLSAALGRFAGAGVAGLGLAAAAALSAHLGSALLDSQVAAQKLSATLAYVAGGAGGAQLELDYLRSTSQRLGLDFGSAATAYARFAAATRESGLAASVTRETFEGVAKAAAHLGLSADDTNGVLLALSQVASKGTVSAEELRGQIGERLPGAFALAARAMGVSEQELGKLMERGEVAASDFLPRFAQALNERFAAPVNNVTSELNRLSSAWDQFKSALFDGNAAGLFGRLTAGLSESAAAMRQLGADAGTTARLIAAVRGAVAGATGNQTADPVGRQVGLRNELTSTDARIARLERSGRGQEGQLSGMFDRQELADLRRRRAAIEGELAGLDESLRPHRASALETVNTTHAAEAQRIANRLKAYLDDTQNETKAVRLAAAIDEENKRFKAATRGLDQASQEYAGALEAHQRRIAEINARGAARSGGGRGGFGVDLEDQRAAQLGALRRQADEEGRALAAQERAAAVMGRTVDNLDDSYRRQLAIGDERDLSEAERQLAAALRQVEEAADRAREALAAKAATLNTDDVIALDAYRAALAAVNDQEERQLAAIRARADESRRQEADWQTGADRALKRYLDSSRSVAQQTDEAFTRAFGNMEDALMNFLTTGRLNFADFAKSLIADLARIELRARLTSQAGESSGGGLGSFLKSIGEKILGSLSGGGSSPLPGSLGAAGGLPLPSFAIGTDYVPRDMVARIHRGERIIPAAENGRWGSLAPIAITINLTSGAGAGELRRAAGAIGREVALSVGRSSRYL